MGGKYKLGMEISENFGKLSFQIVWFWGLYNKSFVVICLVSLFYGNLGLNRLSSFVCECFTGSSICTFL